jgi:spore coat polysaccharide biosynthesis protein SpsF
MLWHIYQRAAMTPGVARVVVATSREAGDEPVRTFCGEANLPVFAGSETDVLDRFYQAARQFQADPVIRITGDCPLVDPEVVGRLLEHYARGDYDHVGVATGAGAIFLEGGRFPDGLDAECFSFAALERTWREAVEPSDREHVTPYIWRMPGRFRLGLLLADHDYSQLRWTVDQEEDFLLISDIYAALHRKGEAFGMNEVLAYLHRRPELAAVNQSFRGQEGYAALSCPDTKSQPKGSKL